MVLRSVLPSRGSAVEVKAEDISKHVASTATNALGGKVAGVQMVTSSGEPGSAPELRIRGIGSYAASSEPLYVLTVHLSMAISQV